MTVQNSQYRFSTEFLSPMPMCQSLPDGEGPSTRYIADRALLQAGIMLNNAAAQAHRLFDPMDRLEDYDDIFSVLPAPDCVRTWQSDLMFAEQRLSGMHPNMLEAVDGIPDVFDSGVVTESIEALFGKQTPQLFWCNWARYLEGLPNGGWEGGTKRIAPSAALFGWRHTEHADRGELVPVAVAVDVRSKASTATPLSGRYAWLAARTYAQVADTTVHEMRSHLYGAHFFQEAIAVATGRYLSMDHPVHRLLRPHLKFLLFNNDLGKQVLVNPGGSVDQLLAGTLAGLGRARFHASCLRSGSFRARGRRHDASSALPV
jgi:arachidonate 15-lipoxygenase